MKKNFFGLLIILQTISVLNPTISYAKGRWVWSESEEKVTVTRPPSLTIIAAPSLLVGDSAALPGFNGQLGFQVVPHIPLNLTADMGLYFYTGGYGFAVVVPILFGMDYHFQIPQSKIKPFFGVNLGPVIAPRVGFGMLFRPGLNVSLTKTMDFNFEPRFGVIGSSFAFVLQLGLRFLL